MKRSSPKTFGRLSAMGSRPEKEVFRTMNLIFFLLAMFFSIVYFIVASTDEVGGNGDHLKDDITTYLMVITALCFVLLVTEFYSSLERSLKLVRLASVVGLIVFVAISIPKVIDMGSNTGNDAADTLVYTFAALALGFAGIAGILNGLEIARNY
tara:strand:+ start:429 stop:890 length:462 start_codon:yes stop_codon:yes gene_type:complete